MGLNNPAMQTNLHPTRIRLARTRGMLLTLLRCFEPDGKGLAGAQAACVEALADDYVFGVGHGDAEAKEAWAAFYGRVSGACRRN
jgi:hypothetical protein